MRSLLILGWLASLALAEGETNRLVAATRDADRGVRYAAVQALGKAGAGVPALVAALDDPEWCVRQAAGDALARVGKPSIDALLGVLGRGKPDARVEAAEALRRIGRVCAPHLRGLLRDDDPRVVFEALAGLWIFGDRDAEAAKGIRPHLESEDPRTRVMAHFALSVADPKADVRGRLAALAQSVRGDSWSVRWTKRLQQELAPKKAEPEPKLDLARLESADPLARERALRSIRRLGRRLYAQRGSIAELLDAEDEAIVRDAAIAMELVGADPRSLLDDHGTWNALLFCRPMDGDLAKRLATATDRLENDVERRDWAMSVGRAGSGAIDAVDELRDLARSPDDELRAAAVWALGRLGKPVAAAIGDRNAAIRAIAAPFVRDVDRLRAVAVGRAREPAVVALRRLGELGILDVPRAALRHEDPVRRIAAVRALGGAVPEAMARDPERDVRIAVAQQLPIRAQLADPNWRVRLASIRTHGRARAGAADLVPFLSDPDLALSAAAADALAAMGEQAAVPLAQRLGPGDEAVWHYAPRLFEKWRDAGAAAVSDLIPVLAHENPTAREVAARCLGSIGPKAMPASAALVHALADRRLPVVAHAALALGRIGPSDDLRAALGSDRARVRAYAAFAVGWALGASRGVDQAFYEPRLPVQNAGEPDPGITREQAAALGKLPDLDATRVCLRGLWSRDPVVAYACAARLDYDDKTPLECERASEVLAPEGFREGFGSAFDDFRYALGSNELPAALEYLRYPVELEGGRDYVYGQLHRSARSQDIPALCWFLRNEDPIRLEAFWSSFDLPFRYCTDHREELTRFWAGAVSTLWDVVREQGELIRPVRWWLADEPIDESRESVLLRLADRYVPDPEEMSWTWGARGAALRALGRVHGEDSEIYLRRVATRDDIDGRIARASLARRGDPLALVRLVRDSEEGSEAFSLLVEMRPRLAAAFLRERLANTTTSGPVAAHGQIWLDEVSHLYGVNWTLDPFLGLESTLPIALLDLPTLVSAARWVPGCRTQRVGAEILRRFERGETIDWEWQGEAVVPLLQSVDADRFHALLRDWLRSDDDDRVGIAFGLLLRLGDERDAALLRPKLEDHYFSIDQPENLFRPWVRRMVESQLRAEARDGAAPDPERLLALQCGFVLSGSRGSPDPLLPDEERAALHAAALAGTGEAAARELFRRRVDVIWNTADPLRREGWEWMTAELERRYRDYPFGQTDELLAQLALRGSGDARAQYWSALRAGRYQWICGMEEPYAFTLGCDLHTLPHWRTELESNCCRISGRLEVAFKDLFGIDELYGSADYGVGKPASARVREWFDLFGGDLAWSPLARRFVPRPE